MGAYISHLDDQVIEEESDHMERPQKILDVQPNKRHHERLSQQLETLVSQMDGSNAEKLSTLIDSVIKLSRPTDDAARAAGSDELDGLLGGMIDLHAETHAAALLQSEREATELVKAREIGRLRAENTRLRTRVAQLEGKTMVQETQLKEKTAKLKEETKKVDEHITELKLEATSMKEATTRLNETSARMEKTTTRMEETTARMEEKTARLQRLCARLEALVEVFQRLRRMGPWAPFVGYLFTGFFLASQAFIYVFCMQIFESSVL
ncbi:hypothetical protein BDV95DRAFT_583123 [Massariosphaeria phaeospora]|uniref:Uncharacterized protein n=1 Tax=Massariosphaeria phaeospora TaxID=100035 RepID=A0A7C8I023_9PLEO|nr:hypothetical protein BDV95DRAFT_583123 [Massariosphaeria phaeospora]